MADVLPFPFATVEDLKLRWPDFPVGGDSHAGVLLEDASQYILDVCPTAGEVSESTRRRVVCSVVRRAMEVESELVGMESMQMGAGPYQETRKALNPHGDFYLTKQEKLSLGCGGQKAFTVDMMPARPAPIYPWEV